MPSLTRLFVLLAVLSSVCSFSAQTARAPALQLPESKESQEEPAPKISAKTTLEQDQAIQHRLEQIFSELEGAEGVRVDVRSGVVSLTGEVPSQNARERAVKLARQVEGVVEVKDKTTLVRDVGRQIAPAIERLRELVSDLIGYLPLIAFALGIFLLFWFLAFLLGKWENLYRRFTTNEFLADFVRQLTKLAVLKVKSEAIRLVKEAFDAAEIVIPEPIYHVRLQEFAAARPQTRPLTEPKKVIDIRRRTDIERQIAEDRRESGETDLLRSDAPLE